MKTIEKVIKEAVDANKYKCGTKEVLQSIKGSKLIVVSRSFDPVKRASLQKQAAAASVPIYDFDGNSVQLGKLCNQPYRVTTIAIKAGTDEEINAIIEKRPPEKAI